MITEAWWAAEFNKKLRQEFSLKKDLQAVFIDTYYKEEDPKELRAFNRNTNELFRLAELPNFDLSHACFSGSPIQASHSRARTLRSP